MLLYNARKLNKGFTLIEMIVVVIIVGVIAMIAAPNFLGLLNRNRVNQGLADMDGAIKEAQRLATRGGQTCKIRFTTVGAGSDKRSVVQIHPDEGTTSYAGCLLNTRELPRDVSFGLQATGTTTVDTIDDSNVENLGFSAKGNPDITGIMVVWHPSTNDQKCIQIQGLLGNIISGNYNPTTGVCTSD